jgi:MFS transporter, DHA1 family, tetracycline resistance protein
MRRFALPSIFAILVLDEVVASLLYPVFPRYTDGMKVPQLWYGLAMFVFSFAQFLAAPALGALSDRKGRRPIFRLAAIGTFLSMILLLPVRYLPFFANRAADGTTNGLYAVVKSAIVDLSPEEDVQRNVGLSASVTYVGYLLGPAVAAGILWLANTQGWGEVQSLVLAGMIFALINIALSTAIPETRPGSQAQVDRSSTDTGATASSGNSQSIRQVLAEVSPITMLRRLQRLNSSSPNLAALLGLSALFALCTGYYTYFGIFVAEGPMKLQSRDISLLFLYFAALGFVSNTVFFSRIAERVKPVPTLRVMYACGVIVMLMYAAFGGRLWTLYLTLTVDMLTVSLAPGIVEGMIGGEADEDQRGEVFGLAQGLQSLFGLLSIAVYTVASLADLRLPFLLFALPLIAAFVVVPRISSLLPADEVRTGALH